DGAAVSHNVNQSWDGPHCRLTDNKLEQGSAYELDTHLDYDTWNNVQVETVTGSGIPAARVTKFDYSTSTSPGQFLMTITRDPSGLNQQSQFTWYDSWGQRHTATDPNGIQTSWDVDDFGRQVHQLRSDGTGWRLTFGACNSSNSFCGDGLLRYMAQVDEVDTGNHAISSQYRFYDSLGRIKY